jgi:heat shock protein HtpX
MWEAIRANKRRSVVLIAVMALLLVAGGMLLGEAAAPGGGWMIGAAIAVLLWAVMALVSFYSGDSIFLASAGARKIEKKDHPTLYNIVEEMCIASGLSRIPDIYIVPDPRPNAFAVGRDPEHASVAVTAGLLNRLNRDEVQGVVAHELGHINNRDVLFVMIAGVMVGAIAMLSSVFLRYMWFTGGGGRYRGRRRSGGGQAAAILMLAGILFAILGPVAAQILYFSLSRKREYLADACGAQYTRYPDGLASALEKIAANPGLADKKNAAMRPMYIVPALGAVGLFSTHPPTEERVRILRAMGGASLADYEAAFNRARGGGSIIPKGSLAASRPVGVRPPWESPDAVGAPKTPEYEEEPPIPLPGLGRTGATPPPPPGRARETSDLLWRLNGYTFIQCACGARLKVPPGLHTDRARCPRCKRVHELPQT